jgi:hypothetical protein
VTTSKISGPKKSDQLGKIATLLAIFATLAAAVMYIARLEGRIHDLEQPAALGKVTQMSIGKIDKRESDAVPTQGCDFISSPDLDHPNLHSLQIEVPPNRKLLQAWYVPTDNLIDMAAFHRIEVDPAGRHTINVILSSPPGKAGQVRIFIYGLYGPI